MGIIKAFSDAVGGTFADLWKDAYTAGPFTERTVVAPGVQKEQVSDRGSNTSGSEGIITNGSKIFVPEHTAAFIFGQGAIENVIDEPGEYEYQGGQGSVFSGDGLTTIFDQVKDRVAYGGLQPNQKQVAFINLREIRGIKFGTRGPQVYNDSYYGTDLEVIGYGVFSVRVSDPEKFVKHFVPPNTNHYTFDDPNARSQMLSEFVQSFIVALNSLSSECRISQLPGRAAEIAESIASDERNAGSWPERFGFGVVSVAVENIEFTPESRELVRQFSSNRMEVGAYEGVSQRASNAAAQQKIAEGIQANGLGDGGGMLFGMNMAQGLGMQGEMKPQAAAMSVDEQVEAVKKMKDLLDAGILSQEEFEVKKKEIMGL